VEGLRSGKTSAPDNPARRPLTDEQIAKVKAVVSERTRDLIDLLRLTAARPGEILSLTSRMIDRSGEVWTAELRDHKTADRGRNRILIFGPAAQSILRKYLDKGSPDTRLFRVRRDSFGTTVKAACTRAGVTPAWTPHFLRHTRLTEIRKEAGGDVSQIYGGHSRFETTQIYAKPDLSAAIAHALKAG
jgi:integrase